MTKKMMNGRIMVTWNWFLQANSCDLNSIEPLRPATTFENSQNVQLFLEQR